MPATGVRIRAARPAEADALTALAVASKAMWGYPSEMIELWRDDLTVPRALIESSPVYVATRGEERLGFAAIVDRGGRRWELEHLWIAPASARRGIGRRLFATLVEIARERGGRVLEIVSDPNAAGFYIALGAVPAGSLPSRPDGRTLPRFEYALNAPEDASGSDPPRATGA